MFPYRVPKAQKSKFSKNEKRKQTNKQTKHPQGFTQTLNVPNFRQDLTNHAFLRVPRKFSVHLGSRTSSPGSKNQNFQKMKKTLPGIHPSYKCSTFQWFRPFTLPESAPKVSSSFRVQDWAPKVQNKKYSKNKKKKKNTSGIHPSSKCAKSQTNLSIYGFPSVPRKFSVHLGSRASSPGPKNQNFQKMKKTLPGIHPSYKCSTFQWFRPFTLPESAPKVSSSFRVQDWAPKVQNKKYSKNKKKKKNTSGIHPSSKCAKSQTNLSIYGFPSAPRKFSAHLRSRTGSPGPKNQNFQKIEKYPRDSPKL